MAFQFSIATGYFRTICRNKLPPPPPTRQAGVYCISVWRRGFSSPRDVVIISVAGSTNTLAHLENWYFCIESTFKVYLKGVNDIVHNFKEHYVTCIALFVVFDLFTSTLHSLTMFVSINYKIKIIKMHVLEC
ncbi:hypothetical protein T02_6407 [Trichinella nativa]|uniref:Uncharacterized protein n=1 Tax=Trichinella nativa TaxID=6335 RepID=A0A0V1LEJ1_9BILA|nr:hypothetical protein T02_6407 [Trichinella nativa]